MRNLLIRTFLISSLFAVISFGIYSNTLNADFVLDDGKQILKNAHIRITDLNLKDLINAGIKSSRNRPVAYVTFALNYCFHQYDAKGYHLVNIVIHILTGILLFIFLKITLGIASYDTFKSSFIAFFASLIWLVHPLHTQSVTYIVQRMNSMSALFYVLAFILYIKGKKKTYLISAPIPLFWYTGSVLAWIIALGSKQTAATFPLFILLYEYYFFQNMDRKWLMDRLKYVIGILILLGVVALIYLMPDPWGKILSMSDFANNEFTITERILTQFRVIIFYLSLIFYPHPSRLNIDHDFTLSHSLINPLTTLVSLLLITGLVFFAIRISKKEKLISFGILWYLCNLVIESSIIPLAIIFEHRTYLPSMFIPLLFVILIHKLLKIECLRIFLFCAVIAIFSFWTHERNIIWHDPISLWSDCVKKSPGKARPNYTLGRSYLAVGDYEKAIIYLSRALRIKPDSSDILTDLGAALAGNGRVDEAMEYYLKAVKLKPGNVDIHYHIGIAMAYKGMYREATAHFSEALKIKPDHAEAHNGIAAALTNLGKLDEAVFHYSRAIVLKQDYKEAYIGMGTALSYKGLYDKAISNFLEALRIDPDCAEAHSRLGTVYTYKGNLDKAMTHFLAASRINPDSSDAQMGMGIVYTYQGKIDDAITHYLEAVRINPDNADAHFNLGSVLYQKGIYDRAAVHLKESLRINPDNKETMELLENALNRYPQTGSLQGGHIGD